MPAPSSDSPGLDTAARRASSFSRGMEPCWRKSAPVRFWALPTIFFPPISISSRAGKAKQGMVPLI